VIGSIDTSEKVSGKGLARLRDAGCEVLTGIAQDECRRLNRRFFTFHEKKRPYITLKWAQSADGYIDIKRRGEYDPEPTWITGKPERALVHKWRASEQAILVGAGTIRADNPRLNVRDWKGADPLRVILSSSGSFNKESFVTKTGGKIILFTNNMNSDIDNAEIIKLNEKIPASVQISDYLFNIGIQSLLIEGGAQVLEHFLSTRLWDEARVFSGRDLFKEGIKAPKVSGTLVSRTIFTGSCLETYYNEGVSLTSID
jgi:diaminohydroxyphosphoribosylaminopyrimidine deaminase/5-amino-6-(5-phosphoribosylamino)uracil reductase